MINKIKIAWDYFIHHPDKTQVIIQVYILNPFYKFIETVVFFTVDTVRKIVLWFQQNI